MARARNIKPAFFMNEDLVELPFQDRLLFIGLWTLADREGRLEDRPKRIKMEIFPADDVNVDESLTRLASTGMIVRYQVAGSRYIQIVNFLKHQRPHGQEKASEIPPFQGDLASRSERLTTKVVTSYDQGDNQHALIPDTGYLNEDTGYLNDGGANAPSTPPKPKPKAKRATQIPETWIPSDSTRKWADSEGFTEAEVDSQILRFVDHWRGKGETRKDWDATFRNWMRNAREWGHLQAKPPGQSSTGRISPSALLASIGGDDEHEPSQEDFSDFVTTMAEGNARRDADTSVGDGDTWPRLRSIAGGGG